MEHLIQVSIPFFLITILIELLIDKKLDTHFYRFHDTISNLSCGIFSQIASLFFKTIGFTVYSLLFFHFKFIDLESYPILHWTLAIVGVDFCYYLFHRASHRSLFFWAFHIVHHSSEEYNLSVALRQSAFSTLVSWIFYLPLAFLGVTPKLMAISYGINLIYQYWIHTRFIKKLGFFEYIFNTPSHHRVHHGTNKEYLDKNYAGILIIWDRLFGTFTEEKDPVVYGITHPLNSWNPIWANTHVWITYIKGFNIQKPFMELKKLFMPPGWPDVTSETVEPETLQQNYKKFNLQASKLVRRSIAIQLLLSFPFIMFLLLNASNFSLAYVLGLSLLLITLCTSWSWFKHD